MSLLCCQRASFLIHSQLSHDLRERFVAMLDNSVAIGALSLRSNVWFLSTFLSKARPTQRKLCQQSDLPSFTSISVLAWWPSDAPPSKQSSAKPNSLFAWPRPNPPSPSCNARPRSASPQCRCEEQVPAASKQQLLQPYPPRPLSSAYLSPSVHRTSRLVSWHSKHCACPARSSCSRLSVL